MLPFLKHSKEGSMQGPVETIQREHDEDSGFDMVEACAEDLIEAVHKKDVKAVAQALRAAFEICDSEPHQEGPHE